MDVDGAPAKPLGDNPLGYLVYTPDGHVFVQYATRAERPEVLGPSAFGPVVLEKTGSQSGTALGFNAYCGTFEVRDGQLTHHQEFGILPIMSGRAETRSAALDGDRLILGAARGPVRYQIEWQRVH
jgi:hypothetical protein